MACRRGAHSRPAQNLQAGEAGAARSASASQARVGQGAGTQKPKMSKTQQEPPEELENQFILRLPPEQAAIVREMIHSGSSAMKDKLTIDLSSDSNHATVKVKDVSLKAKMIDLPCVIESLKTFDNKLFYKTADISQMLVCTAADDQSAAEEAVTSTDGKGTKKNEKMRQKKYAWKHGVTPPLHNVTKKRFRKATQKVFDFKQDKEVSIKTEEKGSDQEEIIDVVGTPSPPTLRLYTESPGVEKELKRLLRSDAEAVSVRWEVISEDEAKEMESQGYATGFETSPGTSGSQQSDNSSEYRVLRELLSDFCSSSDDENEEEKQEKFYCGDQDEEKGKYYEEKLQRELQAKLIEFDQCQAKERASSIVMDIQKHIYYMEKRLEEVRCRAQRQKDLIQKVENLEFKNHLHSVLKKLKLQEEQKNEQILFLQEKLKYFLEK